MSDLTRAITEALDRRHHLNTADLAAHIAAALAPLIEARVRKARADEVRLLIRQLEGGDGDEFDTYLAESLKKPLVLQGFLGGRLAFLSAERVRDA
jgi:hypothetical protein